MLGLVSGSLWDGVVVAGQKVNAARERRILEEIVVDAHDETERAMGWFSYLDDQLQSPFTARCITKRAISPLRVGDEVDVIGMAPECGVRASCST